MKISIFSATGFLLLTGIFQASVSPVFAAPVTQADETNSKEVLERNKMIVGTFVSEGGEKYTFKDDATFSNFYKDGRLRRSGIFVVDKPKPQKDGKVFIRATLTFPDGRYTWMWVKDEDNIAEIDTFGSQYTREKSE